MCSDDSNNAPTREGLGLVTRLGPLNTFPQQEQDLAPSGSPAPSNGCSAASHCKCTPAHDHQTYSQECRPLLFKLSGRINCPPCQQIECKSPNICGISYQCELLLQKKVGRHNLVSDAFSLPFFCGKSFGKGMCVLLIKPSDTVARRGERIFEWKKEVSPLTGHN